MFARSKSPEMHDERPLRTVLERRRPCLIYIDAISAISVNMRSFETLSFPRSHLGDLVFNAHYLLSVPTNPVDRITNEEDDGKPTFPRPSCMID